MAFVYEAVGEKDHELFESLGFKNFRADHPINFGDITRWCSDREREFYLVYTGTFREEPYCFDLYYKGRIVRIETDSYSLLNDEGYRDKKWFIDNINIPKSIWLEKDAIMEVIQDAFSVHTGSIELERPESVIITIKVRCKPSMVEVDYNGK